MNIAPLRTLKSSRPARDEAPTATFVVTVVEGPDAGLSITLDGASPLALVGQSPVCSVRLRDPEASRRHASLSIDGPGLTLTDMGSTNGTTVNGVRIEKAQLQGGEAVRIGRSVLTIRGGSAAGEAGALTRADHFGRVLGSSLAMRKLYALLERLAASDRAALIVGEVATGKDLIAEELAAASSRTSGAFLRLDPRAADASAALESLFGRRRTRAARQQRDVLYVDEVGELSPDAQELLCAVVARAELRVIVATRRDLEREVSERRFSERLFFAVAGGRVDVPPLRDRDGDIELLARHFWSREGGGPELPADFLPRFEHYAWPGNVRELESAVVARLTLGELAQTHRADDFTNGGLDIMATVILHDLPFSAARERVMREFERRYVDRIVAAHDGNVTRAAEASGVALRYFKLVRSRLKSGG